MGCAFLPLLLFGCLGFIVVPILYVLFCLRICQESWTLRILVPALSAVSWFLATAFLAPDTNGALPVYLDAWIPAFIVVFFLSLSHATPSRRTQRLALWSGVAYPLTALLISLLPAALFDGPYPFTREAPSITALVGTYVPSSETAGLLRTDGYEENARVTLKSDMTFEIVHLANIGWFPSSSDEKGYNSCTGTWSITQDEHHHYEIMMRITAFTPDSGFSSKDIFYQSFKQGGLPFPVGIAAPTQARPDCALVFPLDAGDEGTLIFHRKQ